MRANRYDEFWLDSMRYSQTQGDNTTVTMPDYARFLQPQCGKDYGKIIL